MGSGPGGVTPAPVSPGALPPSHGRPLRASAGMTAGARLTQALRPAGEL